MNYAIIAANIFVFVALQQGRHDVPGVRMYMLDPRSPHLYQFFSSVFMHAGWAHLIGNMVFLWVFGNAIDDAFGHVGYLAFYLAGGIVAGIGHLVFSGSAPVLGASGAIAGVTGAFLVLFPRVRVTLLVWFYFVTSWEVTSLVFLAFQFAMNLFWSIHGAGGGVAYWAHSSGYIYGIVIAAVLLATKLLPRDVYDLLSLFTTWRRRAGYQRAVSQGYDPFKGHVMHKGGGGRRVSTKTVASKTPATAEAREIDLRRQISADHERGDLSAAAASYLKLVRIASDPVLPLQQQIDVANHLMSDEQYPASADAYERFLRNYSTYEYIADIWLMLGLIYSRYLQQDSQAEKYLSLALGELHEDRKVEMARDELENVRRRLG